MRPALGLVWWPRRLRQVDRLEKVAKVSWELNQACAWLSCPYWHWEIGEWEWSFKSDLNMLSCGAGRTLGWSCPINRTRGPGFRRKKSGEPWWLGSLLWGAGVMETDKNMGTERQQTVGLKRETRRTLTESGGRGGEKGGSFVSCQDPKYHPSSWQCCFEGNWKTGKGFDQICRFRNHYWMGSN